MQGGKRMKRISAILLLLLLLNASVSPLSATPLPQAAKIIQQSQASVTPLNNQDVLRMVKANFTAETIIAEIKSSPGDFVTTPAALQQLKEEGVPDSVILAMVMAPKSARTEEQHSNPSAPAKKIQIKVPNGVQMEIEAPFAVDSQNVKVGDAISFRVVNPVKVEGVTIIEAGATATARVVLAERGGHFGRAGRLAWQMQNVTAVDGTRIPLQTAGRVVGDSHAAQVATEMAVFGSLLFFAAPLVLLHGFRRGENAVLPAGKRLEVFSQGETSITADEP
jgi:hypothetical protein